MKQTKEENEVTHVGDLVYMYKVGFLDGVNNNIWKDLDFSEVKKRCLKAYNKRFKKGIKMLKKRMKGGKKKQ